MKLTTYEVFAICHPSANSKDDHILLVPKRIWSSDLSCLYKPLNAEIIERTQVRIVGSRKLCWMWADEMGHPHARPINPAATQNYQNGRATDHWIAGPVAYQLGKLVDSPLLAAEAIIMAEHIRFNSDATGRPVRYYEAPTEVSR